MRPFYKLFNSGTSDGAKKGWAARKGGELGTPEQHESYAKGYEAQARDIGVPKDHAEAMEAAAEANRATAKAIRSGSMDDHEAALQAHKEAKEAHERTGHRYDESDVIDAHEAVIRGHK